MDLIISEADAVRDAYINLLATILRRSPESIREAVI